MIRNEGQARGASETERFQGNPEQVWNSGDSVWEVSRVPRQRPFCGRQLGKSFSGKAGQRTKVGQDS